MTVVACYEGEMQTPETLTRMTAEANMVLSRYQTEYERVDLVQGYGGALTLSLVPRRVEHTKPEPDWNAMRKRAARKRFESLRTWLREKYGKEIGDFITVRFAKALGSAPESIDNLRVADKANDYERGVYDEQKRHGCCGFVDEEITHYKSGRTFLYGFNCGH